jgi:hypothetical protein
MGKYITKIRQGFAKIIMSLGMTVIGGRASLIKDKDGVWRFVKTRYDKDTGGELIPTGDEDDPDEIYQPIGKPGGSFGGGWLSVGYSDLGALVDPGTAAWAQVVKEVKENEDEWLEENEDGEVVLTDEAGEELEVPKDAVVDMQEISDVADFDLDPGYAARIISDARAMYSGSDITKLLWIGSIFAAFLLGAITVSYIAPSSGGGGGVDPGSIAPLFAGWF